MKAENRASCAVMRARWASSASRAEISRRAKALASAVAVSSQGLSSNVMEQGCTNFMEMTRAQARDLLSFGYREEQSMAEATGGRSLVLDAITHRYPGGANAVENSKLDVKCGEIIALLGPSGCGKTPLLRIVAGFIAQTEGRIIIGDDIVDALKTVWWRRQA